MQLHLLQQASDLRWAWQHSADEGPGLTGATYGQSRTGRLRLLEGAHTRNNRELSLEKVPEGASSGFEVVAVLVHEVDGDVQGVLDISVEAKALLKHKRQDACSVWVDICPDVAAPAEKACTSAANHSPPTMQVVEFGKALQT